MSAFLTVAELQTLTGYRRQAAQIRWLRARRIKHYVNGAGQPIVAWAWLKAEGADVVRMPRRINLAALREA